MTDWAGLLTAVGGGSGLVAAVAGGVYGYRGRQANYAQATAEIGSQAASQAAEISRLVALDLRGENAGLKEEIRGLKVEIGQLDRKSDQLQEAFFDLKQALTVAIFRLEAHGDIAAVTEIRAALNRPAG